MDAEETKPEVVQTPSVTRTFGDSSCRELLYRIKLSHDKFRFDEFSDAVGERTRKDEWGARIYSSQKHDFHVHLSWIFEEHNIRIQVAFDPGNEHLAKINESVVHAESVMPWLGQFFVNENAHGHIHVEFDFANSQSKFPLPLKTTIGALKASIDGVSISFPDSPGGVSSVWISQAKRGVELQCFADRSISFKEFSVERELQDFLSVINSLVEEHEQ